jgi:hypothetical protein
VVQVRARVAKPPARRPIRRTRPPLPSRQRRRAVLARGWPLRRRQGGHDPPEKHNSAPGGGGWKTGRGAGGRTGSSEGPRDRHVDHALYNQFVPRRCFVRVFREVFILTANLDGQAREVVGRSPLVPRSDAWDLAPLAASLRGGLESCGGIGREPDVRQEFPASGPSQMISKR